MEKKELIGRKVKGFAFEQNSYPTLGYYNQMDDCIGKIGTIISYTGLKLNSYAIKFGDQTWDYPASLIEQHLIPENKTDMELLDKFAMAALIPVLKDASINATPQEKVKEVYEIAKAMLDERGKYEND